MWTKPVRDGLAVGIGLLAFVLALVPLTISHYDPGIRLAVDPSVNRLIVASVDPWSPAARDGVESGMVVLSMNGAQLLALPHEIYADPPVPANPDENPEAQQV